MDAKTVNRRTFHATALSLLLGGAASTARAGEPNFPGAPKTFVLVHGAWYGGWCWDKVAQGLRAQGHCVTTPTCPGVGELAHLLSKDISLTTYITSITNHILYENVRDVILVGSGFGGVVISGVADRIPHLIKSLVYVDAMVLDSGSSVFESQPAAITRKRLEQVESAGKGIAIPAPPASAYGYLDQDTLAWVRPRMTPHPVGTYQEKLVLNNPLGNGRPRLHRLAVRTAGRSKEDLEAAGRLEMGRAQYPPRSDDHRAAHVVRVPLRYLIGQSSSPAPAVLAARGKMVVCRSAPRRAAALRSPRQVNIFGVLSGR